MRRYGGGMLYAALPLHMQRGCFRIRTHDQQVTNQCKIQKNKEHLKQNCIPLQYPPTNLSKHSSYQH